MHKLNKSKKHRASSAYMGLGLIAAPAVISGVILSSSYAFANDSVVDIVNVTVPLSCNVSASGRNSHTATVANGIYTSDIGTTTMKIFCNDNGGFSVYATGYTGGVSGDTNSNKLVGTAVSGNDTIATGTATSGTTSNWAMKLSANSGDDYPITILDSYDDYHAVPNDHTKVATRLSGTDLGEYSTGSTLSSTYAAYFSRTQATDVYTGQVKYTLVHPHNAPTPTTLYLQDTANVALAVPNIGDTVTATDARDGLDYTVGKLPDGNIWLLDNLAIDLTMPNASTKITAANTNASATSLNALFNGVTGGGQDHNLAQAAVRVGQYNWGQSYTEPLIDPTYKDKTVSEVTEPNGSYGSDWTIGIYYNYCAASAGSYCYDEGYGDGDTADDICPAGWRMPTGGENGEYQALYDEYENESEQNYAFGKALQLPFSGCAFNGYCTAGWSQGLGSDGEFWSSTHYSEYNMFALHLEGYYGPDYVSPSSTYPRYTGNAVRCVMDAD